MRFQQNYMKKNYCLCFLCFYYAKQSSQNPVRQVSLGAPSIWMSWPLRSPTSEVNTINLNGLGAYCRRSGLICSALLLLIILAGLAAESLQPAVRQLRH